MGSGTVKTNRWLLS